jgi:hypothetical protein
MTAVDNPTLCMLEPLNPKPKFRKWWSFFFNTQSVGEAIFVILNPRFK